MSRPIEYEVRGAVHEFKKYDKYGRPYMSLPNWKTDIGNIIHRTCKTVQLMICGGETNFRATIYAEPTLTGDDVSHIIEAMENGGYYLRRIPYSGSLIGLKAGLYFTLDKKIAMKQRLVYPIPTWIRSSMEKLKLENSGWCSMFVL